MSPTRHGWLSPKVKQALRDRVRFEREEEERARLAERAQLANDSSALIARLMDGDR